MPANTLRLTALAVFALPQCTFVQSAVYNRKSYGANSNHQDGWHTIDVVQNRDAYDIATANYNGKDSRANCDNVVSNSKGLGHYRPDTHIFTDAALYGSQDSR